MLIILFFFFKQKTAYEMRISDWSSDVCSSDLVHPGADHLVQGRPVGGAGDVRGVDVLLERVAPAGIRHAGRIRGHGLVHALGVRHLWGVEPDRKSVV